MALNVMVLIAEITFRAYSRPSFIRPYIYVILSHLDFHGGWPISGYEFNMEVNSYLRVVR